VRLALLFIGSAVVVSLGVAATISHASSTAASLHFYERHGPTTSVNNPPKGKQLGSGDLFVFTNPVFTRHGSRIGSDHGICTIVQAKPFVAQCTSTIQLPQGQLMLQDLDTATSSSSAAVVGGTGAFAGARGTLSIHTSGKVETIEISLE